MAKGPPFFSEFALVTQSDRKYLSIASSIREHGVLSALLLQPEEERFEIVFGAQRYRAAQRAEAETVSARICELSDAQVLEAQFAQNPRAGTFIRWKRSTASRRFSIWKNRRTVSSRLQSKPAKSPVYIVARFKLIELIEAVIG